MEYFLARRELRQPLEISDPSPVDSVQKMWVSVGQAATIGIFLILFGAFLYVGRAILLPIFAAAVISLTLAPIIKSAKRFGISPWITGLLILAVAVGGVCLAATTLAGPVSEWIGRAPEIGATIKQKLSVFDQPLAALYELEKTLFGGDTTLKISQPASDYVLPVMAFLTPAAGELLLFFATLFFFLVGQIELRNQLVSMFGSREAKLRFLKIMRDVERNLAGYLTVVTIVNATLGAIVALGAWLFGFPDPIMFGLLAAVLNYVPYIGPALMVIVLFGIGLVTFPSLGQAVIAPLGFVALTTAEGHFITPTIVGRRFTLNPLLVFLAIAFWTWMWGPLGAFLAAPLSIIVLVVFQHLFPMDDVRLPE
ncbi:MAG TPA: AI-2E family transporter [Xanthobacteraceae bacterium]|nr:AI-2E family transporter [Xanthobacteraceae bacterium]